MDTNASLSRRDTSTRSTRKLVARGISFLVTVSAIVVWEAAVRIFDVGEFILPAPSVIARAAYDEIPTLGTAFLTTLLEALGGFCLAILVAVLLSVTVLRSRTFELSLVPWVMALQAIPIVAVTPIIALIVGRNTFTALLVAGIISFFPIMVNMIRGLRSVSDEGLELMHVLAASRRQVLWKLRLPASLPFVFVGLRVGVSVVIPGAMIAEWLTATQGLGQYVINESVRFRSDNVWAGILLATLGSLLLFWLVTLVEKRVVPWHPLDDAGEMR
ncbi:MAG TPA: ABC transporter permease [Actinopolymorphaceae bacterium]